MGGSAGKIVKPIARGVGDVFTLGANEAFGNPIGNAAGQATDALGSANFGDYALGGAGLIAHGLTGGHAGSGYGIFGSGAKNPYVTGPFSLDPNQFNADKQSILDLGNKQYADTLAGINSNQAAQTQRAKDLFGQMLPDIAENANAAHLYDSTGYGNEVARQEGNIASQLAQQESDQKLAALTGRQGFETGALQRGQSLEDFINQANVAKTIGAQMAPQAPNGKQNFGTVAQGVGALAPLAKLGKAAVV